MATNLLSPKAVENAKSSKEVWLGDGDGLHLRVLPTGRNWIFKFTSPVTHTRRKQSLGSFPAVSLAQAREKAKISRALVAAGKDPLAEEAQAAQLAKHGEVPRTVADLLQRWVEDYLATAHDDGGRTARRSIEIHALPLIGDILLSDLRASHIVEVLAQIRASGKMRTVAVVLANLRQMIAHAIECDWMPGDPSAAIKKVKWAGRSAPVDRVLSDDEIKTLTDILYKADLAPHLIRCVWLLLATGARIEETSLAQFKHIDFECQTWLIPKENQKKTNRALPPEDFVISLNPFAIAQLKILQRLPQELAAAAWQRLPEKKRPAEPPVVPEPEWIFPAAKRKGPMNNKTLTHALNDRQRYEKPRQRGRTRLVHALELPGGPWTPHDLRRTAATIMQSLRVDPKIVDKCLNHVETNKITATYQHAAMALEMHEAWMKLGARIEQLFRETEDI